MVLVDNVEKNTIFVSKRIPRFAKFLHRINRLCQIIGEIPFGDLAGFKVFGLAMVEVANFSMKRHKKGLGEKFAHVREKYLGKPRAIAEDLSLEDQEFLNGLENVSISSKDLVNQEKDGFIELKADFAELKSAIDEMSDILNKMHHLTGCNDITRAYQALMDSTNFDNWAHFFQYQKSTFEMSRGDFTKENLTTLFQKIYKEKCKDSWQPLEELFTTIWHCRVMYFAIMTTFYQHLPDSAPDKNIAEMMEHEMELYEKDFKILEEVVQTLTGGFFMAALTRDRSWPLQLGYLPEIEEIENSSDNNIKSSDHGIDMNGELTEIPENWNLYMKHDSNFVRVQDTKDDTEYIYPVEGKVIQGNVYRQQSSKMVKYIGSRFTVKSGDEDIDRQHILYRFNKSGSITYEDQSRDKGQTEWKSLLKYRFNQQTLSWSEPCSESTLENIKQKSILIGKSLPKTASNMIRICRIILLLEELNLSNLTGLKAYGLGLMRVVKCLNVAKQKENGATPEENISKEDLEFIKSVEIVSQTTSELDRYEKQCIDELEVEHTVIQNELEEMLQDMNSLHNLPGCTKIIDIYNTMIDSTNFEDWSKQFQSTKQVFEESKKDFTPENLKIFYQIVYEERCKDSLDSLEEDFVHIFICRALYFLIMTTYHQHINGPESDLTNELELFIEDFKVIEDVLETVCDSFFMAGLTRDRSWPLGLAYCPKLADIPKNDDTFWKESTVGIIMYGVSDESESQAKVKLYRNNNSKFVRVHNIESIHEYIYVIDDNGQLKHGIYSYTFPSMNTCIGSRYFIRGDRKEDRHYSLYRFNKSGDIVYEDKIQGKGESWRLLTRYKYKPESLSWEKVL